MPVGKNVVVELFFKTFDQDASAVFLIIFYLLLYVYVWHFL